MSISRQKLMQLLLGIFIINTIIVLVYYFEGENDGYNQEEQYMSKNICISSRYYPY